MVQSIMVNPERLETTANQVSNKASEYEQLYNKMYQQVEAMARGWQGKDNQAYTDKIKAFQTYFQKLKSLMDEYGRFCQQTAGVYRNAQQQVASESQKLT